uniref:peptidyl-tRNA hydrolase n=1 Tax=Tetradesmus obliquus TaxID=3088 RepID=A0A383VZJ1_TETOB|eukprot:jgi/Sobl393_1/4727/SZX70299.1
MQHCSTVAAAAAAGASLVAARAADGAAAVTCTQDVQQQAAHTDLDDLKMVLCVNQSLKKGKGKIGAQCAHAAICAVLQLLASDESLFVRWEQCGQRKIVVKVQDAQCMEALAAAAAAAGHAAYIMRDAGRTQVAPDSQTVLALGPAPEAEIDRLTGHLQLL